MPELPEPPELTDREVQLRLAEHLRRLDPLLTRLFEGGWLQDVGELGAWVKQVGAWVEQVQAGQAQLRAQLERAAAQQDRLLTVHLALLAELRRLRTPEAVADALAAALGDEAPPRAAPDA